MKQNKKKQKVFLQRDRRAEEYNDWTEYFTEHSTQKWKNTNKCD